MNDEEEEEAIPNLQVAFQMSETEIIAYLEARHVEPDKDGYRHQVATLNIELFNSSEEVRQLFVHLMGLTLKHIYKEVFNIDLDIDGIKYQGLTEKPQ